MPSIGNVSTRRDLFNPSPTLIQGEPVALFSTQARQMRHPVRRIVAVYHYDSVTGLRVDHSLANYQMVDAGIARTSESDIYDFADYEITLTGETYVLVTTSPRNPPLTMSLLVYVDYETDYIAPTSIVGTMSSALSGLVISAGDSITGGAHTISREFFDNDGDGYVGLLRSYFYRQFGIYNWSINGSTLGELVIALPDLLAMNPSAITIAFGQNDHVAGAAGLTSFEDALNGVADDCQAAGVKPILIGFMPKNPLWENYSLSDCVMYNDAIEGVATTQGVPFVDIFTPWQAMKLEKSHLELTGDNHHHPNNYGSRLYFSAILPHLLTGTVSSNSVTGYIPLP